MARIYKSGDIRAKGPFGLARVAIYSNWKGQGTLHFKAFRQAKTQSTFWAKVKTTEALMVRRWRTVLTDDQRGLWETYATMLGNASSQEASAVSTGGIIPKRGKLMTGLDAYIGANVEAAVAAIDVPRDTPPLGESRPTAPANVLAIYGAGIVTVTWTDPDVGGPNDRQKLRLWTEVQAGRKIHKQIVSHIDLPSPGSTTFDHIRANGVANLLIPLTGIGTAFLRVQMDAIVARKPGMAPVVGQGSNVAEVRISN